MLKVGLTGGIATGKTIVSQILKNLGCYILEADKLAHKLIEPKKKAWKEIILHFGKEILNPDQTINRHKLGQIIFSNKNQRELLNKIIHPLVVEEEKKIFKKLEKEGKYKIFITEAALIVEAGMVSNFDKLIVVYCDEQTQIKRVMNRDKISHKEALKKIKSQLSLSKKLQYADYKIDTSGSLDETIEQTEQVYRLLMADYKNLIADSG
ncbi:MAG: dephospho-CoA kinase [Candidatus Aminicenantia bacterium]